MNTVKPQLTNRTAVKGVPGALTGAWLLVATVLPLQMNELKAQVLIADGYENTVDSNVYAGVGGYGLNQELTNRQSGALSPMTYTSVGGASFTQVNHQFAPGQMGLINGGLISPDMNFNGANSAGGLMIGFDINPVQAGNAGIAMGRDILTRSNALVLDGFAVQFFGEGNDADAGYAYAYYKGSELQRALFAPDPAGYHRIEIRVTGNVDGNPADGVGDATVEIYADGNATPFLSVQLPGGFADNYISFQGFNVGAGGLEDTFNSIDNFVIWRATSKVPVVLRGQPRSQTVFEGQSVMMSVAALGDNLAYQWRLNEAAIPGATAANYSIAGANLTNAGAYTVVATNSLGGATTAPPAILQVVPLSPTLIVDSFDNAIDANSYAGAGSYGMNSELGGRQAGATSPLTYQKYPTSAGNLSQVNHPSAPGQLGLIFVAPNNGKVSPNLDVWGHLADGGITVSFDVNPISNGWCGITLGRTAADRDKGLGINGFGIQFFGENDPVYPGQALCITNGVPLINAPYAADPSGYHHISIRLAGHGDGNPVDGIGDSTVALYADGSDTPFMTWVVKGGFSHNYMTFEGFGLGAAPEDTFNSFDNFAVWRGTNSPPAIAGGYGQPQKLNLIEGDSNFLSIIAMGENLRYQWFFNGTIIPGATQSRYNINSIGQAGEYLVIVTNSSGSVTSLAATVTFLGMNDSAVLLSDSFNNRTNSNIYGGAPGGDYGYGMNRELAHRQQGFLAPMLYNKSGSTANVQVNHPNATNSLGIINNSKVSPAVNFNGNRSAGGLVMSFDLDPLSNSWAGFTVGRDLSNRFSSLGAATTGLGVLFWGEGTNSLAGSAVLYSNGVPVITNLYTSNPSGFHPIRVSFDGIGDGNPFDASGAAVMKVFADGDTNPCLSWDFENGFANNYIVFEAAGAGSTMNNTFSTIDNLSILKGAPMSGSPVLKYNLSGKDLSLFWEEDGYILESSGVLPSTGWAPIPNVVNNSVTVSSGLGNQFFRLRRQ